MKPVCSADDFSSKLSECEVLQKIAELRSAASRLLHQASVLTEKAAKLEDALARSKSEVQSEVFSERIANEKGSHRLVFSKEELLRRETKEESRVKMALYR